MLTVTKLCQSVRHPIPVKLQLGPGRTCATLGTKGLFPGVTMFKPKMVHGNVSY